MIFFYFSIDLGVVGKAPFLLDFFSLPTDLPRLEGLGVLSLFLGKLIFKLLPAIFQNFRILLIK